MEDEFLIDVALEDDLLIAAASEGSPTKPSSAGLSGKCDEYNYGLEINVQQREHLVKISNQIEHAPELSESPEQKPAKSRKINLRKSLAWDSAFFTNEGVLNAEELALVNSTFGKAEGCTLPRIQEDLRKSTESTSTLDSDSWALETLEVDLFENLRASIQKSLGKCDKASYNRTEQGELNASRLGPSKKIEISSQNKMKPNNALGRHALIKQRPENTSKEALIRVKDAGKTGDSKSLSKPPRIASRATTLPVMPRKKASVSGSIITKNNTGTTLCGNAGKRQSVVPLKQSGDSSSVTHRSIPSPKSSLGSHVSNEVSSVSSSSDSSYKSPLENSRKRSIRYTHHPCEPTTKTLLRTSKSKIGSNNARSPQPCLKSMFNLSSSVSPNSSFDSVVSESSSSNSVSMVKPNNSTLSLDADSCPSPSLPVVSDNILPQPSNFHKFSAEPQGSRIGNSENMSQGPVSTGVHSRSFTYSSAGGKCFKPSGLRMPTPKIGYFDAEKSLGNSSTKLSPSGLQNNLPKNNTGNSNSAEAKKLKPSKLPSVRPTAQNGIMNSDSPYTPATRLSSIQGSKPASTSMTRHQLSKSAKLYGTPKISKDHALCSKTSMDLSPVTGEDVHLELSDSNEEQAGQLNSKPITRFTTTLDVNENLFSTDGTGGLVEVIGQRVSSLTLCETKDFSVSGDSESSAQTGVPIVPEHRFNSLQSSSN